MVHFYVLEMNGHGHARPSFYWYDNNKDLKVCFLVMRAMLYDDRTEQAFKLPHYSARQQNDTSMYSTQLGTPYHMYHVPVNNIPCRFSCIQRFFSVYKT